MKKILLLSFFIFSIASLTAQNSISEIDKLASLGKIHGFLKYYHPQVGKGAYNWDEEFIKYISKVLNVSDKESLSLIYSNWIDSLGKITDCKKCDTGEDYFDKNFDMSWIQDTIIFNKTLISKLKYIENNRIQGGNFYVDIEPVGKIKIVNEPNYKDFEYPSKEYRLLGLFKYWNIVEYFYPYKYLTNQDWDSVLKEMIPKFQKASNKSEYQSAIKELVAKLDDTHAWISFTDERLKYLPVKISHVEDKAVVSGFYNDSIAKLNNLKMGDIILKINDLDISVELNKNLKYVSGSNVNIKIKNTYTKIFSGLEEIVNLTIERNDQIEQIRANRYDFNNFNYWENKKELKSKSIHRDIGFINMASNFNKKDIDDIFESFKNKKSVIIDLRNYPNSNFGMFSRYLNSKSRDFAKIYKPDIDYPGKFTYRENLKTNSSRKVFKGKIILLVNEESFSRSEFTAMAFQTADNIITVGNQTAGADGDVVIFEYLGGFKTAMSGNGVLYPNGLETQRKGIKIDVKVKPTVNGLKERRDEVLEMAIKLASE